MLLKRTETRRILIFRVDIRKFGRLWTFYLEQ